MKSKKIGTTINLEEEKDKDMSFEYKDTDIAVVGMACCFPGARNYLDYWENLKEGRSSIQEIPPERWDWKAYFGDPKTEKNKTNSKWGGFISDYDSFDLSFFNLSAREVELMDPQQRIMMELSWKCMEDAGICPSQLSGEKVGVYIGAANFDYKELQEGPYESIEAHYATGIASSVIANRISYHFNFKGPSLPFDTACSSSLYAIHSAIQSLQNGECNVALAGGVSIMLTPRRYISFSKMGILSPTGSCKTFDDNADGIVRGEGAGLILLKPLKKALLDGDSICGILRGSSINHNGKSYTMTYPSFEAQGDVIADAYRQAGVTPDTISYIETHGTGTPKGDPIEFQGLMKAFEYFQENGNKSKKSNYCGLGSVKTNIGHTESAAGIAAVIKVLLSMKYRQLPAIQNFKQLNHRIPIQDTPFYIVDHLQNWAPLQLENGVSIPRRAGVSAFGFAGTNAHLVIEEAPVVSKSPNSKSLCYLICLSAKTEEALQKREEDLSIWLENEGKGIDLLDISATLLLGREHFAARSVFVVKDIKELKEKLEQVSKGDEIQGYFKEIIIEKDKTSHPLFEEMGRTISKELQSHKKITAQDFENKLLTIAQLYVKGYEFDWHLLWGDKEIRRINLPTYPFTKQRYWIPEEDGCLSAHLAMTSIVQDQKVDNKGQVSDFVDYVKELISETTRIPTSKLDNEANFEEMGMDSIMIPILNQKIEKWVGELDATLFFKYNNIRALGAYLSETYPDAAFKSIKQDVICEHEMKNKSKSTVNVAPRIVTVGIGKGFDGSNSPNTRQDREIAIVGLAGKFPKASTIERFWKNLYEGRDCIEEIPIDRWSLEGFYEPDKAKALSKGLSYCKWGGFIDDVDCFDPLFFNISPKDAIFMDPQERLFLQSAWECIEDAGYTRKSFEKEVYGNKIGVFVGATFNNYQLFMAEAAMRANKDIYVANSQTYSIANRVSYIMNFTGPSLTVDTACSSSLYAVHLACESIRNGESYMAIAGGVNLSLHPSKYMLISNDQFGSLDGRCRAFCEGGTGYVPAEAVGSILLKPLDHAIEDGDHIYGIIKGTAANHGGKTNGYTVPNPLSQSQVIEEALKRSQIDPRTISFVEGHGTGTALGDPIEITGLTDVFRKYTKETKFCAISSVKSSIGHAESAAGITQLMKVLLQLKHQTLVKNVMHGNGLNPNINFDQTPFVVQEKTEYWKRPVINGQEFPRRAGVSSFGAGGTNAHIVVEEYIQAKITINHKKLQIIILSAKDETRLKEQVYNLLESIEEKQFEDDDLESIAYTLQVGREAMGDRLAVLVSSIKELKEKLKLFLEGKVDISDLYSGKSKNNKDVLRILASDEDMTKTIDAWINKEKYTKLLDLWVKGLDIDWEKLYEDNKPLRLSLPTYPFAKERYWVSDAGAKSSANSNAKASFASHILHPLLHRNTSSFREQRFSSSFTGDEFFTCDYILNGQKLLPGLSYLEMACAGLINADEELHKNATGMKLKNVSWAHPIDVGNRPIDVNIGFYPKDSNEIDFEIYSQSKLETTEAFIHGQGSVKLGDELENCVLDIDAIKAQCTKKTLLSDQCYESFAFAGVNYGPGLQSIEKVYVGSMQVLAKIALPIAVCNTMEGFILHPALMESVMQASMCMISESFELKPIIPFYLRELIIYQKCTSHMWALIRYSGSIEDQKFDADLCDYSGRVCVSMKGLSIKALEGNVNLAPSETMDNIIFSPCWKEKTADQGIKGFEYSRHIVVLCELDKENNEKIKIDGVDFIILESNHESAEKRFENHALRVFEEIKNVFKEKTKGKLLIQIVFCGQSEHKLFTGLSGLLKTAHLENPRLIGQIIEIEPNESLKGICEKLIHNSKSLADSQVCYIDGKRYVSEWDEVATPQRYELPWKDGGVYLITGGVGGLGLIWAKEIATHTKGATLILTGRSSLNEDKQNQIKKLEKLGIEIQYKQVDVTRIEEVKNLIGSIHKDFKSLNGIIHAAGIISDNFIIKKTEDEFRGVIEPKILGLANLDQASCNTLLDFFILFSSVSGSIGNAGQSDYSTANTFMDAYAKYRNGLVEDKKRTGETLSINWPLWKDGGMQIDMENEKVMYENTGMVPMQTTTGIEALYKGLASGKDHVMIMEGNLKKIKQKLLLIDVKNENEPNKAGVKADSIDMGQLGKKVVQQLKLLFSEISSLSVDRIDDDESLESYGIDSIMITQLNMKLENIFKDLSKTVFYEYYTIKSLSEYLTCDHTEDCMKWTEFGNLEESKSIATPKTYYSAKNYEFASLTSLKSQKNRLQSMSSKDHIERVNEPIAIIGLSGRFPKSKNIKEYWHNLENGEDCISEIPKDRWSLEGFYNPNSKEAMEQGKSYSKWGGFIDGFADFDPLFFNITPRDAMNMDPQERLFIESCWDLLEDAGYTREELTKQYNSKVGVFAGITKTGYDLYGPDLWKQGEQTFPYTSFCSVANRISYMFNLQGPSMPIDTMCSSSLTAIHEACEYIWRNECEMAIAGGVNLYLHPSSYTFLCAQNMLSEDGRCKSFGKGGNGFVPGEGVGTVLLKRLSKAVAEHDNIYAVIRGTNINHGGKTNGYTVPSPTVQGELISNAMNKAGVNAREVSFIEAHGTGTELGDPIEITGLSNAFRKHTKDTGYCAIGSVKSNIGHLEAAAGIAGVAKIILQMKNQKLVPSLYSKELNPNIAFEKTPFVVQQELTDWKRPVIEVGGETLECPRIAGISAFGAGGSNAHIVIEEYVSDEKHDLRVITTPQNPAIIVLSARSQDRLKEQASNLLDEILNGEFVEKDLANIAYTLQVGREAMEERMAMVAVSINELAEKLKQFLSGRGSVPSMHIGQIKSKKEISSIISQDKDMVSIIHEWIKKGEQEKLLDLWVKGLAFDWNILYPDVKPFKISLPTYPFERDRYWVVESKQQVTNVVEHKNNEQFDKTLYGELIDEMLDENMSIDDVAKMIKRP